MQWNVCEVVEQSQGRGAVLRVWSEGAFGFMTPLMTNSWGYSYSLACVPPRINCILAPRADFDTRKHFFKHTCTSSPAQNRLWLLVQQLAWFTVTQNKENHWRFTVCWVRGTLASLADVLRDWNYLLILVHQLVQVPLLLQELVRKYFAAFVFFFIEFDFFVLH